MIRGDESPPNPAPRMLVGPLAALVIIPNTEFPGLSSLLGVKKFGWLNTLKNWKPIPNFPLSQWGIAVFFMIVKSASEYPGPRKRFRSPVENVPSVPGATKSAAVKHGVLVADAPQFEFTFPTSCGMMNG